MTRDAGLALDEDQARWFRARRTHLAGDGADDVRDAAHALLGAQAQQEPPALFALAQRTRGRPSAEEVAAAVHDDGRTLVRTWGQRETLHLYDAERDWRLVAAARAQWAPGGRRGPMPTEAMLDRALKEVRKCGDRATRGDLTGVAPKRYVEAVAEVPGTGMHPERFAAARLLWRLALRGDTALGPKRGAEQTHVLREAWFPDLDWEEDVDPEEAATELARRYLARFAPATPADVAHFFGARVREARGWLQRLDDAGTLLPVECGARRGLVALAADEEALRAQPPRAARDWPLRLLPLWDAQLMTHKDKGWVVPDEDVRPQVWRKAAYVSAVALARGRVVATWSHKARARAVDVVVQPLPGWQPRSHLVPVRREARVLAAHLGREEAVVEIED